MSLLRRFRTSSTLPSPASSSDSEPEDESPKLIDLYKIALDEYRFQVNLNWSRTQYHIVLNLGILGLATGLLRLEDQKLSAAVGTGLYFAGVVCCVLALISGRVQRAYYRQTKHHKAHIEQLLDLGDLAIQDHTRYGGHSAAIGQGDDLSHRRPEHPAPDGSWRFGLLVLAGLAAHRS